MDNAAEPARSQPPLPGAFVNWDDASYFERLMDFLVAGGRLQRKKTAAEILKDLRFGLRDPDQFAWLRRYHETELMRLGLRDISGQVDIEQTPAELSAFADACLQYALEVVLKKNI